MAVSRRAFIVGTGAAVGAAGVPGASAAEVGVVPQARAAIGVIGTILQDGAGAHRLRLAHPRRGPDRERPVHRPEAARLDPARAERPGWFDGP
jgi:hypothetical protein